MKYQVELNITVEYDMDNSGRTAERIAEQILENICWSYQPATGKVINITKKGETNE